MKHKVACIEGEAEGPTLVLQRLGGSERERSTTLLEAIGDLNGHVTNRMNQSRDLRASHLYCVLFHAKIGIIKGWGNGNSLNLRVGNQSLYRIMKQ